MAKAPPVDVQYIVGVTPSAVNPLPVRLSDGGAFYTAGGGAGGGAATIADGADVAQGATTDAVWVSGGNGSLIALSKYEATKLEQIRALLAASIAVTGTVSVSNFPATQPVSLATNTPDVIDRAARLLGHVTVDNASLAVTGTFFQATQPVSAAALPLPAGASTEATLAALSAKFPAAAALADAFANPSVTHHATENMLFNGTTWDRARGDTTAGAKVALPGNKGISAVSAANATVTLTIPAPGAGLFNYVTSIEIIALNPTITAIAAAASTLSFTTTNIGGLAWSAGTLLAAGAEKIIARNTYPSPIKGDAAATATTIVAPAIGAGGLVRINATYYVAP